MNKTGIAGKERKGLAIFLLIFNICILKIV